MGGRKPYRSSLPASSSHACALWPTANCQATQQSMNTKMVLVTSSAERRLRPQAIAENRPMK